MRAIVGLMLVASLSACATTGQSLSNLSPVTASAAVPVWTPTIDWKGVNRANYEKDYAECRAYADADPSTNGGAQARKGAMKWGLGGLAVVGVATLMTGGAALAALPAMAAPTALYAGGAAATGGVTGKTVADAKYRNTIAQCLEGRGYRVLN